MSKYCGKCGTRMSDNDFLCPDCGAIWGDRIYRAPAAVETAFSAENEALTDESNDAVASPPAPQETIAKKRYIRLLPLILALLCFVFVLVLMEIDWSRLAGESTASPATTDHVTIGKNPETTSPPTVQTMPPMAAFSYVVMFVDSQYKPIEGVKIANPLTYASTPYLESNQDGAITLHSDAEISYIQVISVPSGYNLSSLNEKLYFGSNRYVMTIVLYKTEEIYTSYTVQFADPDGNPIPRVKIENPGKINSYLYSDSNGKITFELPNTNTQPYIWITAVPDGYSSKLNGQRIYFVAGQTSMTVSIPYSDADAGIEIDTPDLPAIEVYTISMSDSTYLYEPLLSWYIPGETVHIKITYDKEKSCMLFADGVEITGCTIVVDQYWKFDFEMPARSVELRVREFSVSDWHPDSADLLRAYYRQNPDAADTELLAYYGKFGDALVGMLNVHVGSGGVYIDKVGEYQFYYNNNNRITVLIDGELITLRQAYEAGYLTDEDLQIIFDFHVFLF